MQLVLLKNVFSTPFSRVFILSIFRLKLRRLSPDKYRILGTFGKQYILTTLVLYPDNHCGDLL